MRAPTPRAVTEDNIGEFLAEQVAPSGTGPHDPDMDDGWRSSVDNRLGELKGALDGLRLSFSILAGAVGLVAAVMAIGIAIANNQFGRLDGRIDQLGNKIEAIPQRLSEEFRAMRAEMVAQTNAIANSITATRQAQPPTLPQIIVIPDHSAPPTPEPPKQ
jgi:hypothetical protein